MRRLILAYLTLRVLGTSPSTSGTHSLLQRSLETRGDTLGTIVSKPSDFITTRASADHHPSLIAALEAEPTYHSIAHADRTGTFVAVSCKQVTNRRIVDIRRRSLGNRSGRTRIFFLLCIGFSSLLCIGFSSLLCTGFSRGNGRHHLVFFVCCLWCWLCVFSKHPVGTTRDSLPGLW
jgi:hypothetical protein